MLLRGPLPAVWVAVVLAGAACSGSSGSAPSTPVGNEPVLTKADLIRTADAACAVFGHRAVEIFRASSTDPSTNAAQWSRAIDLFDRLVARLSALAAPAEDRGDWTRFLTITKTQRTSYVAFRDAYKRHDTRDLSGLYADSYTAAARASDFGASYGLHDCVVNVDTTVVPTTRSDYLEQINGACISAINALGHLHHPQSPDQYLTYLDDAKPLLDQLLRDVRAQPSSAGDEQLLGTWIDQVDVTVGDLRSLGDAARAGDYVNLRKIAKQGLRDESRAEDAARAIGLDQCASAASGSAV